MECAICNISISRARDWDRHTQSKKHQDNLSRLSIVQSIQNLPNPVFIPQTPVYIPQVTDPYYMNNSLMDWYSEEQIHSQVPYLLPYHPVTFPNYLVQRKIAKRGFDNRNEINRLNVIIESQKRKEIEYESEFNFDIVKVKTAFDKSIINYTITSDKHNNDINIFFIYLEPKIFNLIHEFCEVRFAIKF